MSVLLILLPPNSPLPSNLQTQLPSLSLSFLPGSLLSEGLMAAVSHLLFPLFVADPIWTSFYSQFNCHFLREALPDFSEEGKSNFYKHWCPYEPFLLCIGTLLFLFVCMYDYLINGRIQLLMGCGSEGLGSLSIVVWRPPSLLATWASPLGSL